MTLSSIGLRVSYDKSNSCDTHSIPVRFPPRLYDTGGSTRRTTTYNMRLPTGALFCTACNAAIKAIQMSINNINKGNLLGCCITEGCGVPCIF